MRGIKGQGDVSKMIRINFFEKGLQLRTIGSVGTPYRSCESLRRSQQVDCGEKRSWGPKRGQLRAFGCERPWGT